MASNYKLCSAGFAFHRNSINQIYPVLPFSGGLSTNASYQWTCVEPAKSPCVCICTCVDNVWASASTRESVSRKRTSIHISCYFSCAVCENFLVFAFMFAVCVSHTFCLHFILVWFSFCDSQSYFFTLQVVELVLVQCLAVWSLVMPGIHPSSNSFSRTLF